jgi:MFS family permease
MIFIRTLNNPTGTVRPLRTLRAMCVTALIAYPAGALIRVASPDWPPADVLGLLLVLVSFVCAFTVMQSRVSRITAEEVAELDEYERSLRNGAVTAAYGGLAGIVATVLFYCNLASDFGWWLPAGDDHWSGVFWGFFLIANILPATILAFRLQPGDLGEELA